MPYSNSQEQTIYRSLAREIQSGFYDHGERFPSAQEIARRYDVSYCPAQRALKMLEQDGLVQVFRGKATKVIAKPYEDYLASRVFQKRVNALLDLHKSLHFLSPAICFQGMQNAEALPVLEPSSDDPGKRLYRLFEWVLKSLGNKTILSLYYDISDFIQSSFLDILYAEYGATGANRFLENTVSVFLQSMQENQKGGHAAAQQQQFQLYQEFLEGMEPYLESLNRDLDPVSQTPFVWEPYKGRTRYCDDIAIDLICKINQGLYPVDTLLPNSIQLADTYHVSTITIRRTLSILNQLGVVKTINGVGTRVVFAGDFSLLSKFKNFMMDDNLKTCLETLQFLAITCEGILQDTFPHFTEESLEALGQAVRLKGEQRARVATTSACLQAIVHNSPLAAIREIYSKVTLLVLKGSILRLNETGEELVPGWTEWSNAFEESLRKKDGILFAKTFRQLMEHNFIMTKQTLLEIGVRGIDKIVAPKWED